MPKVSVCIPNKDGEKYICEAVESILGQTFGDFELIVVDNCSNDDSVELLANYRSDHRFRYVTYESQVGMAANWNRCLKQASGEYFMLLNVDDYLEKDYLAQTTAILDKHDTVGLVYTAYTYIYPDRQKEEIFFNRSCIVPGREAFRILIHGNHIAASSVIARRSCYAALGEFSERFVQSPDWHMWLRFATRYDLAFISRPLAWYRMHDENVTSWNKMNNIILPEMYLMKKDIFLTLPEECSSYKEYQDSAINRIAKNALIIAAEQIEAGLIDLARECLFFALAFSPGLYNNETIRKMLESSMDKSRFVQEWPALREEFYGSDQVRSGAPYECPKGSLLLDDRYDVAGKM